MNKIVLTPYQRTLCYAALNYRIKEAIKNEADKLSAGMNIPQSVIIDTYIDMKSKEENTNGQNREIQKG